MIFFVILVIFFFIVGQFWEEVVERQLRFGGTVLVIFQKGIGFFLSFRGSVNDCYYLDLMFFFKVIWIIFRVKYY